MFKIFEMCKFKIYKFTFIRKKMQFEHQLFESII